MGRIIPARSAAAAMASRRLRCSSPPDSVKWDTMAEKLADQRESVAPASAADIAARYG